MRGQADDDLKHKAICMRFEPHARTKHPIENPKIRSNINLCTDRLGFDIVNVRTYARDLELRVIALLWNYGYCLCTLLVGSKRRPDDLNDKAICMRFEPHARTKHPIENPKIRSNRHMDRLGFAILSACKVGSKRNSQYMSNMGLFKRDFTRETDKSLLLAHYCTRYKNKVLPFLNSAWQCQAGLDFRGLFSGLDRSKSLFLAHLCISGKRTDSSLCASVLQPASGNARFKVYTSFLNPKEDWQILCRGSFTLRLESNVRVRTTIERVTFG